MSMNILNDISAVYMDQIAESAVPGKPAERLGAVTAIPKSEKEAAAKRIRDKTKAKREAMKTESLDPVGQEDDDIDNDGDTDKSDKYLLNRRKVRSKAISKRKVEEGFSNWRQDLSEVMGRDEKNTKIKEKKEINNKVKTSAMGGGIKIDEAVEEIGGTLIEMVEIDEVDYIVESVYDELLGEGYDEDDIEEALEYALTEAKVTFGHDTPTGEKKRGNLVKAVGRLARQKLSSKIRGAKASAKAAVARGARKVAKGALGVARKIEGGDKTPKTAERKPSTYRGAGVGTKEKVSSGSYTAPTKKKVEKPADPWEGTATTPPKAKAKKAATPTTKAAAAPKRKRKASKLDSLLTSIRNEETRLGEGTLQEKALSKQQQKFMGMVYAVKKGDMAAPSPEVAKAASGMTKQQAKDFAKTKHKGLPQVKEDILNERENDEPGEGPRQKYGDMRGIDRSGPPTSFGGKWQSKERKSAGAAVLAKRPKKVEESVDEIPMTPQELNLRKKKSAIDIMIAKRRQQSILKNKNQ